jgi:hypothetical protein
MIVSSFGRYLPQTAHDHETGTVAPLRSPVAAGLAAPPPPRSLSASLSPLLSHIIPAHLFIRISHLISK